MNELMESAECWDCGGEGEHHTSHVWRCYTCKGTGRISLGQAKERRREEAFKKSDIYNKAVNEHHTRVTNFKFDDFRMTIVKAREKWEDLNAE